MNEENRNIQSNNKGITIFEVIIIILVIGFIIFLCFPRLNIDREPGINVTCLGNLRSLGLMFQMYATDNSNSYPSPDKWCDMITPYLGRMDDKIFQCPYAKEKAKSHYAMNPDCEPNSPPDTVLLFETQNSNWNLFGGKELLTTENHGGTGCNIVFNDGSSAYIKKEEIPNLKWDAQFKEE